MPDDPKPEGAPEPESAPPSEPATPEPKPAEAAKPAAPAPEAKPPAAPAPPKPAAAAAAKPAPAAAAKPPVPKAPAVMAVTPWESDLTKALAEEFGAAISEFSSYVGQSFLVVKADSAIPVIESLKFNHGFDYLVDVTAVHYPERPEPLDVIYILYSFSRNERIRVKIRIKDGDRPRTVTKVHTTADWLEREVYDMFGIEFEGHPNMKRILLPDEWSTFPLRKENSILNMDQRWVQENLGIESGQ